MMKNHTPLLPFLFLILSFSGLTAQVTMDTLLARANEAMDRGDFDRVVQIAAESESIAPDPPTDAYFELIWVRSYAHFYLGNWQESLDDNWLAYRLAKQSRGPNDTLALEVFSELGGGYAYLGQYDSAHYYMQEAQRQVKKTLGTESELYGTCLNNLGFLHEERSNYDSAAYYLRASLKVMKNNGNQNTFGYAITLNNLSLVYENWGYFGRAMEGFDQAIQIARDGDHTEELVYTYMLNNRALLTGLMGDYRLALTRAQEALKITREIAGPKSKVYDISLDNLADIYMTLGQHEKARPLYEEALQSARENMGPEHPQYARALSKMGQVFVREGNYEVALEYFQQSRAVEIKANGPRSQDVARANATLASLYEKRGEYDQAADWIGQAVEIIEADRSQITYDYADLLAQQGQISSHRGDFPAAEQQLEQALEYSRQFYGPRHDATGDVLYRLARHFVRSKDYPQAADYFARAGRHRLKAIQQWFIYFSEEEQKIWLQEFQSFFDHALRFALEYPEAGESLLPQIADQQLTLKGMILNNQQQQWAAIRRSTDLEVLEYLEEWRELQELLARQQTLPIAARLPDLPGMKERAAELERTLIQQTVDFSQLQTSITWEEVQAQLQPGEVAIEFVRYLHDEAHYRYAALLIAPNPANPRLIPICDEATLQLLTDQSKGRRLDYVNQLYAPTTRGLTPEGETLPSLFALTWEPLQAYLAAVETIYYAPSGLLHRINHDAIPVGPLEILADRYDLHLLGSVREITVPNYQDPALKRVDLYGGIRFAFDSLAIANAFEASSPAIADNELFSGDIIADSRGGSTTAWPPLAWTDQEVQAIQDLLTQQDIETRLFREYAASEQQFKWQAQGAAAPDVLHLATHGYFYEAPSGDSEITEVYRASEDPMIRSGLILAGANRSWLGNPVPAGWDDGILTAYEIANLDLSGTKLVVLSACETGLGEVAGNEGVFGLQRAFKLAGASHLIMSLWQVPDYQTQELMQLFYANWLENGKIRTSFREAQEEMRNKYQMPYFWAGFVLME